MREKPPSSPGTIVWPKFPKRKREYGKEPKEPVRMGSVISSFGIAGIDLKLREYRLRKVWPRAVGSAIAKRAAPVMLIGSTLHCAVSSSAWITELNFQKAAIIKKVNSALGESVVTKIILKPGIVEEPERAEEVGVTEGKVAEAPGVESTEEQRRFIEAAVKEIDDAGLKEAIKRAMRRAMGADKT